ncbi:hypothetical protein SDC9_46659 [bioreactor metagenome]|uniref:RDRP core domain-containing protein n=1 Tax=bioreactor metagenome TaxID=1076179 RepID=A0A644W9C7_9ZZZZ
MGDSGELIKTKQYEILRISTYHTERLQELQRQHDAGELTKAEYDKKRKELSKTGTNRFDLSALSKFQRRRLNITIDESELVRMILAVAPKHCEKKGNVIFLKGLIELDVAHTAYYRDVLIPAKGLILVDNIPYRRFICSAGHARARKAFFVAEEIWDKLLQIQLCGIDPKREFAPSKVNAYQGLAASSSVPVSMPRFVVVPDGSALVHGIYDYVTKTLEPLQYAVKHDVEDDVEINPFDGAGLVSVEMATQWAEELQEKYLPGAFQFRCIPGIKGVVFTFDIRKYARECGNSKIIDCWGKEWGVFDDHIDAILTDSQFKFRKKYTSLDEWRNAFEQELFGYKRTFNIAKISESADELDDKVRLAYQLLQTLNFTEKEIKLLAAPTVTLNKKAFNSPDAFLRYRGVKNYNEDGKPDEAWNRVPAYFKALYYKEELFDDPFIYGKVKDSLETLRKSAYAGKLVVKGNYQLLAPDLYGLAQHAFGQEVNGLLGENEIYSKYWSAKSIDRVAMMRNPHIAREHNIMSVKATQATDDWFKYQDSSIITGMHDTAVMRMNGADVDGDTILTTSNPYIIRAIERETIRTIIAPPSEKPKEHEIGDIAALMEADYNSFCCDIGAAINPVTMLWSLENRESNEIQDTIKIRSVIGAEVIDSAKTGKKPEVPKSISGKTKDIPRPHFLYYVDSLKHRQKTLDKYESNQPSTMDRICRYMENELCDLKLYRRDSDFDYTTLLSSAKCPTTGPIYSALRKKVIELHHEFKKIVRAADKCRNPNSYQRVYDSFFACCAGELLSICRDVDKAINYLLVLYYSDKEILQSGMHDKSIIWNTFPDQMIKRAQGIFNKQTDADCERLLERAEKNKVLAEKDRKRIELRRGLDFPYTIYETEMTQIKNLNLDPDGQSMAVIFNLLGRNSEADGSISRKSVLIEEGGRSNISRNRISTLSSTSPKKYSELMSALKQSGFLYEKNDESLKEKQRLFDVNLEIRGGAEIAKLYSAEDVAEFTKKYFSRREEK